MSDFRIGDRVRVKADRIDGFKVAFQPKINRGRVGEVVTLARHLNGRVLVDFQRDGRRPRIIDQFDPRDLERTLWPKK